MTQSFFVGGPWFRHLIDVRTMGTVIALAYGAPRGFECMGVRGADALLDLARTQLLANALHVGRADWLISIDNDVALDGAGRDAFWRALTVAARTPDVALVGCPAQLRRGQGVNVSPQAQRPERDRAVDAVGTGLVAFKLRWYRECWPAGTPYFQSRVVQLVGGGWDIEGEDFAHCARVRELSGVVWCAWDAQATHHVRGD